MTNLCGKSLKHVGVVCLIAASVVVGAATSVEAAHALKLSSDGEEFVILENDLLNACANDDCITYFGSIGVFSLTVTTGTVLDGPALNLTSIHVSSSAAGTLVVEHTQTDLTGAGTAFLGIGGTMATGGSSSYAAYWDPNNVMFATSNQIGELLSFGDGAFSGASAGSGPTGGTYSLTQAVTINHTAAGSSGTKISSFGADLAISVPEPATVAMQVLVSFVLLGLAVSARGTSRRRLLHSQVGPS